MRFALCPPYSLTNRNFLTRAAGFALGGRIRSSTSKEKDMDIDTQLETKAGLPSDVLVTQGEMMRAFEAFKEANDQLIAEKKRGGDVLLEEKVARLNDTVATHQRRFEDMSVKSARPPLASERSATQTHDAREHKAAFDTYVRSGESAGLRALEVKAMSVGSNPDGGYTVPVEIEKQIGERVAAISPIRLIAGVQEISGNVYKKPFMTTGPAVGWVGETDARTQTASPVLDSISFPAMELYAMPAATATLLEDSAVNIDEWLAGEVEQVFAVQEGAAFARATAPTSRRASCRTPTWRTPPGPGATSATSSPARPAPSRPRTRPTCWWI
jgi:HK97 family phage major capsid protein